MKAPLLRNDHTEGPVAKAIEHQTEKIPSDVFLWLALGSMAVSAGYQVTGKRETANFIGQWVPTLLILGLYNKLVKVAGSDRTERGLPGSSFAQSSRDSELAA